MVTSHTSPGGCRDRAILPPQASLCLESIFQTAESEQLTHRLPRVPEHDGTYAEDQEREV